jgi:DNA-3-methyladenine glycosylase II
VPGPAPEVLAAEAALALREDVLAPLIATHGPCPIGSGRRTRSHFEALARSITFQQLAGRAAQTIWERTRSLVDGPFTAPAVLTVGEERLRSAGLSGSKARAMLDLADQVAARRVRLDTIGRRDDETVIAELSQVWGIGRWTAEMFLMFQLGRLDVWPTGDLGVREGWRLAHRLEIQPTPKALELLGEPLQPIRSVAAWYCWQAVHIARGQL